MVIEDEDKALHLLGKISYYRMSGYWYPLYRADVEHQFKEGASFNVAFDWYCFDKNLRKLISCELEKIEIAIRASIIHILSGYFGPFWVEDPLLFPKQEGFAEIHGNVVKEYGRCDEKFIESFKNKYSNLLPPGWMLMEITSFGTLSTMYKYLKPGKSKIEIAESFGLDTTTFESWLHTMVYVRNICAHHNRLWNRVLSIRPIKLLKPQKQWLVNKDTSNSRIFYFASIIVYLLNTVNPNHQFKAKFLELIRSQQNLDYNRMGFPDGWQDEPLWR